MIISMIICAIIAYIIKSTLGLFLIYQCCNCALTAVGQLSDKRKFAFFSFQSLLILIKLLIEFNFWNESVFAMVLTLITISPICSAYILSSALLSKALEFFQKSYLR